LLRHPPLAEIGRRPDGAIGLLSLATRPG